VAVLGDDDLSLLRAWRQGNRGAGELLLARHFASLYRFFRSKVEDPEDLIQDTLLACVEGRDRIRDEAGFRAYMFGVARHRFYDYLRRRSKCADIDFGVTSVRDLATSPSQKVARQRQWGLIAEAMQSIPADYQIALELYYWEEMRGPELAVALDVPEPTVRSRLRRGLSQLRKAIGRNAATAAQAAAADALLDSRVRRRDAGHAGDPATVRDELAG